jgi:hypothetical protein
MNVQGLNTLVYENNTFEMLLMKYCTNEKKEFVNFIRVIIECCLCKRKVIRVLLCSEMEYLMFEIFVVLLVKLIIFHKNSGMKIESCQFRNGKCYFSKIITEDWYTSNRSVSINQNGLKMVKEFGLKY